MSQDVLRTKGKFVVEFEFEETNDISGTIGQADTREECEELHEFEMNYQDLQGLCQLRARSGFFTSNIDLWRRKIAGNMDRNLLTQKQLQKDGWNAVTGWACEAKNPHWLEQRASRFLEQSRAQHRNKAFSE